MQNYSMGIIKKPLSSGEPTRTAKEDMEGALARRPQEQFEVSEHIWQWFVDRKLAEGPLEDDNDRFVFHSVPTTEV